MIDSSESPWTEITIQPDGRVYIFGMSRQVLEIIGALPAQDSTLHDVLVAVQQQESKLNKQETGVTS